MIKARLNEKSFLAYFFGGLACMGMGAGVYIAIGTYFAAGGGGSLPFAARMTTNDAVNELLPLVGKRLSEDGSKSQPMLRDSSARTHRRLRLGMTERQQIRRGMT